MINTEKTIYKYRWQTFSFITIFIIKSCFNLITPMYAITSGIDQFGTIASAAYLSGRDWSELVSRIAYYGFGYSAFMAPIFSLNLDPFITHFIMLTYNAICLGFCGTICYNILAHIFKIDNTRLCYLSSVAAILFSNSILNTNVVINEAMLFLLNWSILYILLLMQNRSYYGKNNCFLSFVLPCVLCYGLLIHTRIFFFWGALIIFLLVQYIISRKRLVCLKIFLPTFAFSYIASKKSIDIMQEKLWLKGDSPLINSVDGLSDSFASLINIFSINGFKAFIKTIIGHLYSMYNFTGGLCVFILITFFACIILLVYPNSRTKVKNKINENRYLFCALTYVVSMLFAIVLLTAASTVHLTTIENSAPTLKWILYVRYWAITVGPATMLAITIIYKLKRKKNLITSTLISGIVINLVFLFFVAPIFNGITNTQSGIYFSYAGMSFMKFGDVFTLNRFILFSIISMCFSFSILILFKYRKHTIAVFCLLILFLYNGFYDTFVMLRYSFLQALKPIYSITNIVNNLELPELEYPNIYTNIKLYNAVFLQYYLMNCRVLPFELDPEIAENKSLSGLYITDKSFISQKYLSIEYNNQESPDIAILIDINNIPLRNIIESKGYNFFVNDSIDFDAPELLYDVPNERRVFSGAQQLMPGENQFGPYVYLPQGRYEITIHGENLDTCNFKAYTWVGEDHPDHILHNIILTPNMVTYSINITQSGATEFFTSSITSEVHIEGISVKLLTDKYVASD